MKIETKDGLKIDRPSKNRLDHVLYTVIVVVAIVKCGIPALIIIGLLTFFAYMLYALTRI